ncbi:DUF2806 domain-containing protein [Pararhizobium antarcticum]|uniref:DUF2806 domain-containing protein n=1 Tax=Pararhizobium antarcticum TaxID=1798805 RepID=A0A657LXU5_9HYPH|nr:DUF2806 domain-containing protein [Pararhizobium antarcticum]OJF91048.1 hypothetical protein AX761_06195 [Rhizobium sp. 58]OJF99977.1 hypothetical protein AX760_11370 [Pararhizobium antarcticum]
MPDENAVEKTSSTGAIDLFGIAGFSEYLANPIIRGVGKALEPLWDRVHNAAKRADFSAWDEALKLRGYHPETVQLTLGQRADVQILAKSIQRQDNSEAIAAAAIDYARHEFDPGDTLEIPILDTSWIDKFWSLAQDVSDAETQIFWGNVLARASFGQGQLSPRALTLLTTLVGDEARAIERLAPMVIRLENFQGHWDVGLMTSLRVPYPLEAGSKLAAFKTKPRELIGGFEHDLFSSIGLYLEEGYAHDFIQAPFPDRDNLIEFSIGATRFSINGSFRTDEFGNLPLGSGTGISPLGNEIFGLVKAEADPAYVEMLTEWCNLQGCELKKL